MIAATDWIWLSEWLQIYITAILSLEQLFGWKWDGKDARLLLNVSEMYSG